MQALSDFIQSHNQTLALEIKKTMLQQPPADRGKFLQEIKEQKKISSRIVNLVNRSFCPKAICYQSPNAYYFTQKEIKSFSAEEFNEIKQEFRTIFVEGATFPLIQQRIEPNLQPQDLLPNLTVKIAESIYHVSQAIFSRESEYFRGCLGFKEGIDHCVDLTNFATKREFTAIAKIIQGYPAPFAEVKSVALLMNAAVKFGVIKVDEVLSRALMRNHILSSIDDFNLITKTSHCASFLSLTFAVLLEDFSFTQQQVINRHLRCYECSCPSKIEWKNLKGWSVDKLILDDSIDSIDSVVAKKIGAIKIKEIQFFDVLTEQQLRDMTKAGKTESIILFIDPKLKEPSFGKVLADLPLRSIEFQNYKLFSRELWHSDCDEEFLKGLSTSKTLECIIFSQPNMMIATDIPSGLWKGTERGLISLLQIPTLKFIEIPEYFTLFPGRFNDFYKETIYKDITVKGV